MHNIRKMYCNSFSSHFRFLNFNENMGISDTNKALKITIRIKISQLFSVTNVEKEYPSPTQKMAFAGVAKPRKEELCRSSILNFASRKAENKVMMNPANESQNGNEL